MRRSGRFGLSVRRRSALGFAVAACLVLVAGISATAFAINGPGGFGPGKTVELESQDFTGGGGYSGPWYNPADDTFWSYEWAGYKYHFPVRCVGNNIESVTYDADTARGGAGAPSTAGSLRYGIAFSGKSLAVVIDRRPS